MNQQIWMRTFHLSLHRNQSNSTLPKFQSRVRFSFSLGSIKLIFYYFEVNEENETVGRWFFKINFKKLEYGMSLSLYIDLKEDVKKLYYFI